MANETIIAALWLTERLTTDPGPGGNVAQSLPALATGGVHDSHARAGTSGPFVVFRLRSPGRFTQASGGRIQANPLYDVYVRVPGNSTVDAEPIAARIDARLDLQSGEVSGGRVIACVAEAPLDLSVVENDLEFRLLGSSFRLQVQRVPQT